MSAPSAGRKCLPAALIWHPCACAEIPPGGAARQLVARLLRSLIVGTPGGSGRQLVPDVPLGPADAPRTRKVLESPVVLTCKVHARPSPPVSAPARVSPAPPVGGVRPVRI